MVPRTSRLRVILMLLLVALLAVPSVVTAPVQAGPMRVTQVTVKDFGTRLVVGIVATGQILFSITEIETPLPPRVAIDILNAIADDRVRVAKEVKKGNVLRVRVGQFQDNPAIARVVVDLVRPVRVDVQRSAPNILAVSVPLLPGTGAEATAAVSAPILTREGPMTPAVSAAPGTGLIRTAQQPLVPGAPAGPGLIKLLEFRGVALSDVLTALSKLCGFNLVTDSSVQGTITLRLLDVTCEEALRFVLEANGLAFRRLGKNLIVGSAEKLAPPPEVPETISYHLSYGDVNAIRAAVAAAVPGVRVAVDPRTNALLITGTSAQHEEVVKVLGSLDIKIPQVVIQVNVVEINTTAERNLGLFDSTTGIGTGAGFGNVVLDSANRRITFTLTDTSLINFRLQALINEGKARILTAPRVATLDGNKATIVLGGLIDRSERTTILKVPLLGDIPILGELFRSSDTTTAETEVIFMITPQIVKD